MVFVGVPNNKIFLSNEIDDKEDDQSQHMTVFIFILYLLVILLDNCLHVCP